MGGKVPRKKIKTGGRHKQDEMSSTSSENSQGMPEPKWTNSISRMADMTKDDVVTATSEKSYSQDPALAVIWEAVAWIEANTDLLVSEQKELKTLCEELQRSLQFTQAEGDNMKERKPEFKGKDAVT